MSLLMEKLLLNLRWFRLILTKSSRGCCPESDSTANRTMKGLWSFGLVNYRKANWSVALKHLSCKPSPNESWIQANLAWALGKSGSWQQAETAVAKALQLE